MIPAELAHIACRTLDGMNRAARTVAAAVALAALALAGCTGSNAVVQDPGGQFHFVSATKAGNLIPVADRKKAGDLTGQLLDGHGTFKLAQDAGKVVVINFWASWCVPCVTETPQFQLVYQAYQHKGATFLGIDIKDQRGKARSFVSGNHITYPMIFDEEGQSALALGNVPAEALPFSVLVDKSGRVAAVYVGALLPKDLEPILTKLLAEK